MAGEEEGHRVREMTHSTETQLRGRSLEAKDVQLGRLSPGDRRPGGTWWGELGMLMAEA